MEIILTLSILTLFAIIAFIPEDKELYRYRCHNCQKRFLAEDLGDLKGPWHIKDWTCPNCKHPNVTIKAYN